MKCLMCKIRKASQDEFMDFLNWLSEQEYYEQILYEYEESLSNSASQSAKSGETNAG